MAEDTRFSAEEIAAREFDALVVEAFKAYSLDLLGFIWDNDSTYYLNILKNLTPTQELLDWIVAEFDTAGEDGPEGYSYQAAVVLLSLRGYTPEALLKYVATHTTRKPKETQ